MPKIENDKLISPLHAQTDADVVFFNSGTSGAKNRNRFAMEKTARRASLFSSARSAEEKVCVHPRPSAVKYIPSRLASEP
jgi:hypothetical protein